MTKIIKLKVNNHQLSHERRELEIHKILDWVSEMNSLLAKIETSLENTPKYGTQDLNR